MGKTRWVCHQLPGTTVLGDMGTGIYGRGDERSVCPLAPSWQSAGTVHLSSLQALPCPSLGREQATIYQELWLPRDTGNGCSCGTALSHFTLCACISLRALDLANTAAVCRSGHKHSLWLQATDLRSLWPQTHRSSSRTIPAGCERRCRGCGGARARTRRAPLSTTFVPGSLSCQTPPIAQITTIKSNATSRPTCPRSRCTARNKRPRSRARCQAAVDN